MKIKVIILFERMSNYKKEKQKHNLWGNSINSDYLKFSRMNSLFKLLIFFILLGFISCTPEKENSANFELLPAPKNMTLSGSSDLEPGEIKEEFEQARGHFIQGNTLGSFEGEIISLLIDKELSLGTEGYELIINSS